MTSTITSFATDDSIRVMGTDATISVVSGGGRAVEAAYQRLRELERLWSRFDPSSELSAINAGTGTAVAVGPDTLACVALAVAGWRMTSGRFDPMIHDALIHAGYDRTLHAVTNRVGHWSSPFSTVPSVWGCGDVLIDQAASTVTLPAGAHMDLGGIGKGYAADLVLELLRRRGATGACIDIGGDIRVWGQPPDGDGWVIDIEDPADPRRTVEQVWLVDGAVATSSRMRRTWPGERGPAHHLIDPQTGRPARSGVQSVTVIAADGWLAEVAAKAAFMSGVAEASRILDSMGATGVLVDDEGVRHTLGRGVDMSSRPRE